MIPSSLDLPQIGRRDENIRAKPCRELFVDALANWVHEEKTAQRLNASREYSNKELIEIIAKVCVQTL
jgi:hypothetical protein